MEDIKTKTGATINALLEQHGLSIRDFAIQLDMTYEFARKIIRGESLPSKPMLKQVAAEFEIEVTPLLKDLVADQITKRYGTVPLELAQKKPGMAAIERHWDALTTEQQKDLTDMAISWSKRSKIMTGSKV